MTFIKGYHFVYILILLLGNCSEIVSMFCFHLHIKYTCICYLIIQIIFPISLYVKKKMFHSCWATCRICAQGIFLKFRMSISLKQAQTAAGKTTQRYFVGLYIKTLRTRKRTVSSGFPNSCKPLPSLLICTNKRHFILPFVLVF